MVWKAAVEATARLKANVGWKATAGDQDCLKPRAEPKLKVAVALEQAVRVCTVSDVESIR